jgi:RNA polymerase sigma-70 factor (ECF subfamily)
MTITPKKKEWDDDAHLLQRYLKGDRDAAHEILNKHQEYVLRVAISYIKSNKGNIDDANDVVQQVFMKIFEKADSFDASKGNFGGWMHRITINTCIEWGRLFKKHDKTHSSYDTTDAPPDSDTAPLLIKDESSMIDELDQKDALKKIGQLVIDSLSGLSQEQRDIFIFREMENLSYEEMSEALDLKMGTVMSRLFYARNNLCKLVEKACKDQNLSEVFEYYKRYYADLGRIEARKKNKLKNKK